ncbi:MAG: hypothetical protein DDT29_01176 [Dehalococcoidia bacterium]|nr:hypothetical protein [Bacillota bacterium]
MNFEEILKFIVVFTPLHLTLMNAYKKIVLSCANKKIDGYTISLISGAVVGTSLLVLTSDIEISIAYISVAVIPAPLIHDFMVFIRKVKNRV